MRAFHPFEVSVEGFKSMSFLKPATGATAIAPNAAASGLGHLFGADPSRVSSIADRIGTGMNQIAAAGGAMPGYQGPQVNNVMQMLDTNTLQGILDHFRKMPVTMAPATPLARAPGGFY